MKSESDSSRRMAMRLARRIGCSGAHQNDKGEWLPCESLEELTAISNAAEGKKGEPPCIGCKGAAERQNQGDKHKKRWQKFRERGVTGIDTLEDGSLVSGMVPAAKELHPGVKRERVSLVETKGIGKRIGRANRAGIGGARGTRPAVLDMDAEDMDGDGWAQDGTTAAHRVSRVAKIVNAVGEAKAYAVAYGGKWDDLVTPLGRSQTQKAVTRYKEQKNNVNALYNKGKEIQTAAEAKEALKKAFPNTRLDRFSLLDESKEFTPQAKGIVYGILIGFEASDNKEEIIKTLDEIHDKNKGAFANIDKTIAGQAAVLISPKDGRFHSYVEFFGEQRFTYDDKLKATTLTARIAKRMTKESADPDDVKEMYAFGIAAHEMGHVNHYMSAMVREAGVTNTDARSYVDQIYTAEEKVEKIKEIITAATNMKDFAGLDEAEKAKKLDEILSDATVMKQLEEVLKRDIDEKMRRLLMSEKWADDLTEQEIKRVRSPLTNISWYGKFVRPDMAVPEPMLEAVAELTLARILNLPDVSWNDPALTKLMKWLNLK